MLYRYMEMNIATNVLHGLGSVHRFSAPMIASEKRWSKRRRSNQENLHLHQSVCALYQRGRRSGCVSRRLFTSNTFLGEPRALSRHSAPQWDPNSITLHGVGHVVYLTKARFSTYSAGKGTYRTGTARGRSSLDSLRDACFQSKRFAGVAELFSPSSRDNRISSHV